MYLATFMYATHEVVILILQLLVNFKDNNWLTDCNGMSAHEGLFYTQLFGNRVY